MNEAHTTRTSLRETEPTAGERIEDSMFDRDSDEDLGGQHPEWCVDLGEELRAMNKFELWLALGTGDVAADARVWRVGRECWQPACEIPDLACALKLHAQVLMATVKAAEADAEGDRVTLVPGELPTANKLRLSIEGATEPTIADAGVGEAEPAVNPPCDNWSYPGWVADSGCDPEAALEPVEPAATDTVEPEIFHLDPIDADVVIEPLQGNGTTATETTSEDVEAPSNIESAAKSCDQDTHESEIHMSPTQPDEVDGKSVTPGPATVDAPEPIREAVIRKRRGVPRKQATSPRSGIAAIAALAATSMFTLPGALSSNAPSAAAHLPNLAEPAAWKLAAQAVPSVALGLTTAPKPSQTSILPHASTSETSGPARNSERSVAVADATDGSGDDAEAARTRPSKHRVRPTSVTPSHRGQGRSRQHSR